MARGKALVIGGSGGIGSVVALGLASEGITSALIGRDIDTLTMNARLCYEAGEKAFPVVCDLSRTETIEAAVSGAIDKLDGLNYLINCAGVSIRGKLHEVDAKDCDANLDINFRAHYHIVRYCLPEINKHCGGAIIKIGSVYAPYSGANLYPASNQGLDGYAQVLFEDIREYGTKVCTIKPGYVNTTLVQSASLNSALMIQPEDIAKTVLFVLSIPDTACPTEIVILPQRSPYRS